MSWGGCFFHKREYSRQSACMDRRKKLIELRVNQSFVGRAKKQLSCEYLHLMPRGASLIARRDGSVEAQRCRWRRVLNLMLLLHHFLLHVETWGHLGDCHHDAATRPQRLYPEIDQILLRQRGKHGHIDFAVYKVLNVMMQPDSSQQRFDVAVLRQLVALAWRRRVEQRGRHVEHSSVGLMSVDPGICRFRVRFERGWRGSRDSSSLP